MPTEKCSHCQERGVHCNPPNRTWPNTACDRCQEKGLVCNKPSSWWEYEKGVHKHIGDRTFVFQVCLKPGKSSSNPQQTAVPTVLANQYAQASHQNRWMQSGLPETIPSYGALTEAPGVFEHPISGAVHNMQSPAYGTATAGWPSSFGDAVPQAQYAAIAYPPGYPNMLPGTQHSTAASTGGSVPATNPVGGQQAGQPVANAAPGAAGSHNGEYLGLLSDDDADWDLSDAQQK